MDTLGSRIKFVRKQRKVTQTDIQKKTGISSGNLSEIENDKVNPTASKLLDLRRILGVSVDWLLTGEGEMYINVSAESQPNEEDTCVPHLTADQLSLLRSFELLSTRDKKEVVAIIRLKLEETMGLSSSSNDHSHGAGIA